MKWLMLWKKQENSNIQFLQLNYYDAGHDIKEIGLKILYIHPKFKFNYTGDFNGDGVTDILSWEQLV